MKTTTYITALAILFTSFTSVAEPSSEHASQASKHSALALAHGAAGSAQVASAVVAVPLVVGGSIALSAGAASVEMGENISKVATHSPSKKTKEMPLELEVTEITITVDRSPAQAMKDEQ